MLLGEGEIDLIEQIPVVIGIVPCGPADRMPGALRRALRVLFLLWHPPYGSSLASRKVRVRPKVVRNNKEMAAS
jgi:hypothetical protein